MAEDTIRFDDGASGEHMMGRWSGLVGDRFLDWIDAPAGARRLDVGCSNVAFTELVVIRCRPADVRAFDPLPGQLAYARQRLRAVALVTWAEGDAMQLPVGDASVDAAVMAQELFFVPAPAIGVADTCRAVRRGGVVAAYHWGILGGGFPLAAFGAEVQEFGVPPRMPPSVGASTLDASAAPWQQAGLPQRRTCQCTVQRRFDSFDEYWNSAATGNTLRAMFDAVPAERRAARQADVRRRLQAGDGPLTVSARECGVRDRGVSRCLEQGRPRADQAGSARS